MKYTVNFEIEASSREDALRQLSGIYSESGVDIKPVFDYDQFREYMEEFICYHVVEEFYKELAEYGFESSDIPEDRMDSINREIMRLASRMANTAEAMIKE